MKRKIAAFTVAEVLIVIGIIGMVANMTIPSLLKSTQDQATVTKVQKTYATLENAYRLAISENGPPNYWASAGYSQQSADDWYAVLSPHLNIMKSCGTTDDVNCGCFSVDGEWKLGRSQLETHISGNPNWAKAILADGVHIAIAGTNSCAQIMGNSPSLKTRCSSVYIDVNGPKVPNELGRDVFVFWSTQYGLQPIGTHQETYWPNRDYCQLDVPARPNQGSACSGWVIEKGNLDYLKCKTGTEAECSSLSW